MVHQYLGKMVLLVSGFHLIQNKRYITDESIFKLEKIIGAKIDMDHFYNNSKTYSPDDNGTRWNAGFQIKMNTEGELGAKGIHCHINDGWNHSGYRNGWAAVVFFNS